VTDHVAAALNLTDAQRSDPLASGTSRFDNMVAWARFYLAKAGLVDASRRGVWALTEKGRSAKEMAFADALALFKEIHQTFSAERRLAGKQAEEAEAEDEEAAPEPAAVAGVFSHREEVLQILMSLPPAGFEHFCQRLLRESGFQGARSGISRRAGLLQRLSRRSLANKPLKPRPEVRVRFPVSPRLAVGIGGSLSLGFWSACMGNDSCGRGGEDLAADLRVVYLLGTRVGVHGAFEQQVQFGMDRIGGRLSLFTFWVGLDW
jgi:hypothetical protein